MKRNGATHPVSKRLYACPVCGAPLGRITWGTEPGERLFTSLPGVCVRECDGARYEVNCACGAAHRFIGADRVIRFRIVQ